VPDLDRARGILAARGAAAPGPDMSHHDSAGRAGRDPNATAPALPEDVARLFWDVAPSAIDLVAHADYVMERVMSRGTLAAMNWLRRTYGVAELADFLRRKAHRLSPRDRAYWALIAGLDLPQVPGGARPPWAGP
jgi:hypothetical protein